MITDNKILLMFRMTGSETDSPEAMERSREGSVCTLGVSEGQCPKNHVSQKLKSHCYSECGGGLREVASLSVLSTVASVFAGLALLASSLAVAATVLFCKYRFDSHLQKNVSPSEYCSCKYCPNGPGVSVMWGQCSIILHSPDQDPQHRAAHDNG